MAIRETGDHPNIIKIFDHGWLKGSLHVYFIDMELATCVLAEYIAYMNSVDSTVDMNNIPSSYPVFVHKNCSYAQRLQNMWVIGAHISSALKFMHRHKLVHRDLKPSNGAIFFYNCFANY